MKTEVKLILCATEDIKQMIDWTKARPIMDEAIGKIEDEALIS